jgi:hypothetical protein
MLNDLTKKMGRSFTISRDSRYKYILVGSICLLSSGLTFFTCKIRHNFTYITAAGKEKPESHLEYILRIGFQEGLMISIVHLMISLNALTFDFAYIGSI